MLPARAKRYAFNALLTAMYLGLPAFFVMVLYPLMLTNKQALEDLDKAERSLAVWSKRPVLPTQTRIESELRYKKGMEAEIEHLVNYYQHRDAMLERDVLEAYTKDPIHVKLQYGNLKAELARKARHERTRQVLRRELLDQYPWEGAAGEPRLQDFALINKRACIAEAMVEMLCARSPCHIGHITIGAPVSLEDEPTRAAARAAGLSYVTWPVKVECLIWFRQLGRTLARFAAAPTSHPCAVLRSVEVSPSVGGHVVARLGIDVLDFQEAEPPQP
jgi:hypothetical protein